MTKHGNGTCIGISAVLLSLLFLCAACVAFCVECRGDSLQMADKPSSSRGMDSDASGGYVCDNPGDLRFSLREGPDTQYERIIIRRILHEQAGEGGIILPLAGKTGEFAKPPTLYGFGSIPETTVSTLVVIGGLFILRHRRRG